MTLPLTLEVTLMPHGKICYLEIPADRAEDPATFYSGGFDWTVRPREDGRRRDRTRLFVELTPDGVAELQREIIERSVPSKKSWWGCDVIQIDAPDGNELLFPLPNA